MQIEQCDSLVLKISDYRESDRIVTLYTLEHGRLTGIARGAARSMKRFGGALSLFARLNMQMKIRHGLSELKEADITTIHPGIRGDIERIAHASYACEIVSQLAPEGMPNPRLFRLLTAYLSHLDTAPATSSDRRFFEINILNILGYRPDLERCSACGFSFGASGITTVATAHGKLYCEGCITGGHKISMKAVDLLVRCLKTGRFGAVVFSGNLSNEAGILLDTAISSHIPYPLKSLAFLKEIAFS